MKLEITLHKPLRIVRVGDADVAQISTGRFGLLVPHISSHSETTTRSGRF
jgi:hypothetical protein